MDNLLFLFGVLVVIGAIFLWIAYKDRQETFDWFINYGHRKSLKQHFLEAGVVIVLDIRKQRVTATFSRKGVQYKREFSFSKAYSLYGGCDLKNKLVRMKK